MAAAGIVLSDSAVEKIRTLVAGTEAERGLRVKVVGGGCSGLSYKMDLDQKRDGDRVFERDGARLIVDRKSYLYLNGTTLDYVQQGLTGGFTFVNPNAKSSCGCGTSFSA